MAGITAFECEEEYDQYMQAEAEAIAEQEHSAVIDAMQFLVNQGVEPNHYKSFYELNKTLAPDNSTSK